MRKGPGGVSRTSSSSGHSLWEYLDKFYEVYESFESVSQGALNGSNRL
jgi:hypothetical protein